MASTDLEVKLDAGAAFEQIFQQAMRVQAEIERIVLASNEGLVIASKSRTRGNESRVAALAPVLDDAGESMFNELGLAPLGEVMLLGGEGTSYLVRLKSSPALLLLAAKGQVNLGLLRMVAGRIETEASELLQTLLR